MTNTPPRSRPTHRVNPKQSGSLPPWKESLRLRCLERARHARRDAVRNARLRNTTSFGLSAGRDDGFSTATARDLVTSELQAKKVTSPLSTNAGLDRQFAMEQKFPTPLSFSSSMPMMSNGDAHHFRPETAPVIEENGLTEEDLYDLMREVEEELRKDETLMANEILEAEQQQQMEQLRLESMVEDYYNDHQPNNSSDMEMTDTVSNIPQHETNQRVLCPICRRYNLVQSSANVILCPGPTMEHSNSPTKYVQSPIATPPTPKMANPPTKSGMTTSFNSEVVTVLGTHCLRLDRSADGLTMANLQERIYGTYREHEGTRCVGEIHFNMVSRFGLMTLCSSCSLCAMDVIVA